MGDQGTYTLLKLHGKDIGGLYTMQGPMFEGVPPHWMSYVAVADVDATAKEASQKGGAVVAPPMDVPGVGRMAVLKDPQGAVFSLFKGGEHPGAAQLGPSHGMFCWNELMTSDTKAATAFYTGIFPWKPKVQQFGPTEYTSFMMGDAGAGGMMALHDEQKQMGVPPCWTSYIAVDDCDAAADKAAGLGANIFVPPTDIPGVGRFAVMADPTGAAFGIIRLNS
jgi:hypothetical protein